MTKPTPPFDLAVAELEQELGKPATQWTLRDDLECTRRMYRILGWDENTLRRGSAADRVAIAAKKGAERRTHATSPDMDD